MKKLQRKLKLDTHTLRILDSRELPAVAGNGLTTMFVWLSGSCHCDDNINGSGGIRG